VTPAPTRMYASTHSIGLLRLRSASNRAICDQEYTGPSDTERVPGLLPTPSPLIPTYSPSARSPRASEEDADSVTPAPTRMSPRPTRLVFCGCVLLPTERYVTKSTRARPTPSEYRVAPTPSPLTPNERSVRRRTRSIAPSRRAPRDLPLLVYRLDSLRGFCGCRATNRAIRAPRVTLHVRAISSDGRLSFIRSACDSGSPGPSRLSLGTRRLNATPHVRAVTAPPAEGQPRADEHTETYFPLLAYRLDSLRASAVAKLPTERYVPRVTLCVRAISSDGRLSILQVRLRLGFPRPESPLVSLRVPAVSKPPPHRRAGARSSVLAMTPGPLSLPRIQRLRCMRSLLGLVCVAFTRLGYSDLDVCALSSAGPCCLPFSRLEEPPNRV